MIVVSIIVPVYNVEHNIRKCITSILLQSYEFIEVILIDDGSQDNSGHICDDYEKKDKRVHCYHKQNAGLGLARNTGLKYATGDYVLFIDSDDYIDTKMVEIMLEKMIKHEVEMVSTNFIYNGQSQKSFFPEGKYSGEEINNIIAHMLGSKDCNNEDQFNVSACTKLYSRKVIIDNNIYFPSERILVWEDLAFNCDYLSKCSSIYIINDAFYHYCYNQDSLTHSYNPEKFKQIMIMYRYLFEKIKELEIRDDASLRLAYTILGNVRTCLKLEAYYLNKNGFRVALKNIQSICADLELQKLINIVPKNRLSFQQNILNIALRYKLVLLVYAMSKIQNIKKHGRID